MMSDPHPRRPSRRKFLTRSAIAASTAAVGATGWWLGSRRRVSNGAGKKVIVIGIDGMDPVLCESMMKDGRLPSLAKLRAAGGFSPLGTSIPPQSPVAWANLINGAGPGSHGIFDFVHRHPHEQCRPFYSAAETVGGKTVLRRQGTPFWDYLDEAGVSATFYDLPSNYPPSPSHHSHCRCISGMGTSDLLGTFGTYQYFTETGPPEADQPGGKHFKLSFENETARTHIVGPQSPSHKEPHPLTVGLAIHRDRAANGAILEVHGRKVLLKVGQWSRWVKLTFELPWHMPNVHGIVRFYLQEVTPHFRLYVSPVNMSPEAPAVPMSEPESFVKAVSKKLGLFYTTGFQEDYSARKNNVFTDDEYLRQADMVLQERLSLFDYALDDYDDGLLFFYFSSSDLQSHVFWWTSDDKHPIRSANEAKKCFGHVKRLYRRLDQLVGDLLDRYGSRATIFVLSDHGFADFGRQFNLNSWLREHGYLSPQGCTSIMQDVDWSRTSAYGLGINGLYLNIKGRERDGIVEPGTKAEELLAELKQRLEAVTDPMRSNERVIRTVYRADQVYAGTATELAPDLIVGYRRGYRASWASSQGDLEVDVLSDNESAWSADHCADALEVPGVLFCSRPFQATTPALIDIAPSILAEYGLPVPASMTGRSIFG